MCVLLWSSSQTISVRLPKPFFMKKVQPAVDAIDTRIETLKKEVADLEGRRERLLASIGGSSCFGDQPLISGLR